MKRLCAILGVLVLVISLCACSKTSVDRNADVTLTFVYQEENICVTLEENEADRVIAILDGKRYDSVFCGIPSCSFHENISVRVGDRIYAIARDTCNCVQDLENLRFITISIEDMEYIHTLFAKYGGYFPCI